MKHSDHRNRNVFSLVRRLHQVEGLENVKEVDVASLGFPVKQGIYLGLFSRISRNKGNMLQQFVNERSEKKKAEVRNGVSPSQRHHSETAFEKVFLQLVSRELRFLGCPISALDLVNNASDNHRAFQCLLDTPENIVNDQIRKKKLKTKSAAASSSSSSSSSSSAVASSSSSSSSSLANRKAIDQKATFSSHSHQRRRREITSAESNRGKMKIQNNKPVDREEQQKEEFVIDFDKMSPRNNEGDFQSKNKRKSSIPKKKEEKESVIDFDKMSPRNSEEEEDLQSKSKNKRKSSIPTKEKPPVSSVSSSFGKDFVNVEEKCKILEKKLEEATKMNEELMVGALKAGESLDSRKYRFLRGQNMQLQRQVRLLVGSMNAKNDCIQVMENDIVGLKSILENDNNDKDSTLRKVESWRNETYKRILMTQNKSNVSQSQEYRHYSKYGKDHVSVFDLCYGNSEILNLENVQQIGDTLSELHRFLLKLDSSFSVIMAPFLLSSLKEHLYDTFQNSQKALKKAIFELSNLGLLLPQQADETSQNQSDEECWPVEKILKYLRSPKNKARGEKELQKIYRIHDEFKVVAHHEKMVLEKENSLFGACHKVEKMYVETFLTALKSILESLENHIRAYIVRPIEEINQAYKSLTNPEEEEEEGNGNEEETALDCLLATLEEHLPSLTKSITKSAPGKQNILPLKTKFSQTPFLGSVTQRYISEMKNIQNEHKSQYDLLVNKKLKMLARKEAQEWKN